MATPLSEALVRLRADPTGLAASIERETNQAVARAGPAQVPIQPIVPPGARVTWGQIPGTPGSVAVPITPTLPPGAGTRIAQTLEQQISAGIAAGLAAGRAQTAIGGRQSRFGGELSREAQAAAQAVGGLGQRLSQQLAFFGPTGLAIGATTLAIGASAKAFADFETELNTFGVVSDATNQEMEEASRLAKQLGADFRLPSVSATDAAVAMTQLSKAGLDVNDTFGGTEGVLQLATAAQIDFASAAELTASALNAFRLPGTDATRVADLLTGAANAAQGSIGDMGLALRQSAAVARLAGFDIDETVTSLTILAKAGIAGSDAGTSLRTTLLRLIAPSDQAQKILEALGVSVRDAEGNITPEVFERLRLVLNRLAPATRQTALAMIFGADAVRAASFLTETSARQFGQLEEKVSRAGQASEVTEARAGGLAGKFDQVKSSAHNLGIEIGEFFAPSLGAVADQAVIALGGLTDLFEFINSVKIPTDFLPDVIDKDFKLLDLIDEDDKKKAADFFGVIGDSAKTSGGAIRDAAGFLGFFNSELADFLGLAEEVPGNVTAANQSAATAVADKVAQADLLRRPIRQVTAEEQSRATDVADKLAGLRPKFNKAGKDLGEGFGEGIVEGIETATVRNARRAVAAAQRNLADVVAAGARLVEQSVRSAQQNLVGIGSELAAQAVQLIDAGPLGQRIAALQAQLDRTRQGRERGRLRDDLKTAEQELAEARKSVETAGPPTAEQKAAIANFLKPFQDRVKDAQAALEEFNTEGIISRLTNTATKQKEVVTRGIADVVAAFNAGAIDARTAQERIAAEIGKAIPNYKTAGKNLGIAFRQEFLATLAGLTAQINAIVAGPTPKTSGAGPEVEEPVEAVKQAARDQADAQRRLRESNQDLTRAINDAKKKHTDDTSGLSDTMKDLIRAIKQETAAHGGGSSRTTPTTEGGARK